MKTTHVMWDHMWEKYFSDYPGWTTIMACEHKNSRHHEEKKPEHSENLKNSYIFTDTNETQFESKPYHAAKAIEKSYSVDEDRYYDIRNDALDYYCFTKAGAENGNKASCSEKNAQDSFNSPFVQNSTSGSQPKDFVYECATGQGFAFTAQNGEVLTCSSYKSCFSKVLGTISLDAAGLMRPKTKIAFSCKVSCIPRFADATTHLEFFLSRSCNNSDESVIGNWVYDSGGSQRNSEAFRFISCNCNSFPGFCHYYVRVIPICIKNCCVCITDCHMEALAQSS